MRQKPLQRFYRFNGSFNFTDSNRNFCTQYGKNKSPVSLATEEQPLSRKLSADSVAF